MANRVAALVIGACLVSMPHPVPHLVQSSVNARPRVPQRFSASQQIFLDDLQRHAVAYFWEQGNARTGLVLDRTRLDGSLVDETHRNVASIAATGFGLTGLCIAAERRWLSRSAAHQRVKNALRFFATEAPHEQGWYSTGWMQKPASQDGTAKS